jgi:hypothetical protein
LEIVGRKPNAKEKKDLTIGTRVVLQQWKRLELKDEVLYRTIIDPQEQEVRQLVLPEILKERVIRNLHNDMGHQGLERTILLARSRCYWPGMYTDVEKWIKSCERCVVQDATTAYSNTNGAPYYRTTPVSSCH